MKHLHKINLFIICLIAFQQIQAQTNIYVNHAATGANNGTSWTNAFTHLQDALTSAVSGDEIWIAAGTYYPDQGGGQTNNDRNATFQLKNDVSIYGGFAGGETLLAQRDWTTNETILSGDINQSGDLNDNSYTVVTGSGTNTTAVLDGFTITGGNANTNNFDATGLGGGMYNNNGSPTVNNCTFSGNAADFGGGMFNQSSSSPLITNTTFSGNSANNTGGGMYNTGSSPAITNSIFSGNIANNLGGGIYNLSNSSPAIINTTFSGNTATNNGGAIYNAFSSSPSLTNSIIWNNEANGSTTSESASVFNFASTPTFSYSLVANSGGSGSWNSAIGTDGGNNIAADPLFVNPQAPGLNTAGNYRLQFGSVAIGAGLNTANTVPTDLDGNTRLVSGVIDMGAYENQVVCPTGNVLFVASSATGTNTGDSWTNAFTHLQDALNSICPGITEIWVAEGTYLPVVVADPAAVTVAEREATFQLKNDVAIYGGFVGTETTLAERDWVNNVTILSGDINGSGDLTNNSYTVVTGSGNNSTAVIDGFTITGGNANIPLAFGFTPQRHGGGMYNSSGSPTVANCIFSGNTALSHGGGMFNVLSSPAVTNCTFSGNSATANGGGMYNIFSSPTVTNSTFSGNSATDGAGMFNLTESSPMVTNSTFSGNSATNHGGGIFNRNNSSAVVTNSIIWNNSAGGSTTSALASVSNDVSTPTFSYSLVANSGGSGSWVSAIGSNGGNNIATDPLFVNPQAPGLNTAGDYRLQVGSTAIDAGLNSANTTTIDLDGNPRVVNSTIDMGAYENQEVCSGSNILYVASSASGTNNGTSWTNAFTNLQDALNSSCPGITQIWVAAGTYYPDQGGGQTNDDRDATFQLKNGVAIYGGFAGTEATLAERDWVTNTTILSGDINQNGNFTGNAYTVVTGSGTNNTAVIDGFIITAGNANGDGGGFDPTRSGGGMFNNGGSPSISNTTISGNTTNTNAGGMLNINNSSPTIRNSTFSGNTAIFNGGGMYNLNGSSPIITNSTFLGNTANGESGGMYNNGNSSPTITNSTFTGNTSNSNGGGMVNDDNSSPTITNSTFTGNTASNFGGGMFNRNNSSPVVTNSIIWNNKSSGLTTITGASVYNFNSTITISYSLVANSGGSGSWATAIGADGGNNIDVNPLFVNPQAPGLSTAGDYRLQFGSPAIDAGLNSANTTPTDLDGNPRVVNSTIDMGAYENQVVCPTGNVLFVASSATGNNDGTSWTNAFTNLQDALNSSCPGITELWVATGTYYPDQGGGQTNDDRDATFQLKNSVAIYGGFAGTETTLAERDWVTNMTILSGDINQSGNLSGNAYTVVTSSSTNNTAVIDGFTITAGNADVSSGFNLNPNRSGGGMFNNGGSPTITNIIFSGNTANIYGGGMLNFGSSPNITNTTFSGNWANSEGGGMFNFNSSPTITNTTFSGNTASDGGGMYNDTSSPIIINSTFSGNTASDGGGMYNDTSSPVVTNSTFSGNRANNSGGGMFNLFSSSPTITNTTFSGNTSTNDGGGICNLFSSSPSITNTIIWNNTAAGNSSSVSASVFNSSSNPSFSYSLIANSGGSSGWVTGIGTNNANNIDVDPLFVNPQTPGLSTLGDYRLQFGSPAINAGLNSANSTTTDLDGNERIVNGTIDLGAYERQVACPTGNVLYVASSATGTNEGTSWADAFTNLQDALNSTCPGLTEIWVAAGTYYPDEGIGQTNDDRNATFQLKNNIGIFGGFAGTESTLTERDWVANITILSGDINQSGDLTGNSYTVVTGSGTNNKAVIDGFTITAGNADVSSGSTLNPNRSGGGMFNLSGSPTVINSTFSGNMADFGGGMFNNNNSSPTITNTTFSGNTANSGGGMINVNSSPTITNTAFSGNTANVFGGGMYNSTNSSPNISNSTFSRNTANSGGGMINVNSSPSITNSIFWNNEANGSTTSTSASVENLSGSTPTFSYSLIANSGGSSSWATALGTDGGNNIDVDPLFVAPATDDFTLQKGSLAINAGDNATYQTATGNDPASDTDLAGNPRLFQSTIDMGAFEADFKQSQWRGTVSEDWANNSNWDEDVPDDQSVALIRDISLNTPNISATTQAEASDLILAENTALNVNGVLKVTETINNDGQITFTSDDIKTGQLDTFTGTLSGSGEVTVERYIPAKRAYRLLSSPVTTTDFIYENWQENGTNPTLPDGLGTHITGGSASDGFDQSGTNNPSMFTFDNTFVPTGAQTQFDAWTLLPNTNATKLSAGEAYLTMVRGDRTIDLTSNASIPNNTTLSAKGDLFTGTSSPSLSNQLEFYSLVANPYQAVVDYSLVSKTDLTDFIYIWDASIGGNNGRGGYVTVEVSNNLITDPNPTTSDASKFIAPGMSFFVQNPSSGTISPSLTFEEEDKATGADQVTVFNSYPHFYINSRLYLTSDLQNGNSERDAVGLRFSDNFTTLASDEDATKLGNPDENFAIVNNGLRSIDKQALPEVGHKIDLSITNYTEIDYSLTFLMENKPQDLSVFLKDEYLNTETELTQSFVYDFTVDQNIPESIAEDRFEIRFETSTFGTNEFDLQGISVYPNPTSDILNISLGENTGRFDTIELFDTNGRIVAKQFLDNQLQETQLDVNTFSTGVYLLKVSSKTEQLSTKIIIK